MLGSTDSNFGEWPHDFLCFSQIFDFVELVFQENISLYLYPKGYILWKCTYGELVIFSSEHKSISWRHIWRVSYFLSEHKPVS